MAGDLIGAYQAYAGLYHQNNDDGEAAYMLASTIALHGQFPDSAFHYLDIALEQQDSMRHFGIRISTF